MVPRLISAGKLLPGQNVGIDFAANLQSHPMKGLGELAQSQRADYHHFER